MLRRTVRTMMKRVTAGMLLVAALAGGAVPQVTVEPAAVDVSTTPAVYSPENEPDGGRGVLCVLFPGCCVHQR